MDQKQVSANLKGLWIVTPARAARFTIDQPGIQKVPTTVREYRISAIGRYLVSPAALNIQKRLVGCEIHRRSARLTRWKHSFLKLLGKTAATRPPELLTLDFPKPITMPSDINLRHHIHRLYDNLRTFDTFYQNLARVDMGRICRVTGICEDDAGNRSPVVIDGKPDHQLEFIRNRVGHKIDVRIKRAHFADGLFEMKGFDFTNFDPSRQYRLIRFVHNGIPKACVTEKDDTIAFWLEGTKVVNYLQLLECCIQKDGRMRESLNRCIQGKSAALSLMFNQRLEIDYSRAPLPAVFREAIGETPLAANNDHLIKQNLNLFQVGVSFTTRSRHGDGDNELRTHLSILQDLRALEPIKDRLPSLFEEMAKQSAQSEEGKYYLLETICGVNNESRFLHQE